MKKASYLSIDDEINFVILFKELLKNKFLILVVTIIFSLFAYILAINLKKDLKAIVTLKNIDTNIDIFDYYKIIKVTNSEFEFFERYKNQQSNSNFFYEEFYLNLSSSDNISNFLQQSKDYDLLKKYLELNNVTAKQYFSNNKLGIQEDKKANTIIVQQKDARTKINFFLIAPKEVDGLTLLQNYVDYTNNKTLNFFKDQIKFSLNSEIVKLENELKIAKLLNIVNPTLHNNAALAAEPKSLFYLGSKVLSLQIGDLKANYDKLENFKSNFNIIIDRPSYTRNGESKIFYVIFGSVIGFILSLIIIFIKKYNYK